MGWPDTEVAIVFFVISMIICLANEFLLYLHTKLLQRQELLVEQLLRWYGRFNVVCTPIVVILMYGVIGLLPTSTVFGDWFCGTTFFVANFWVYLNASFSLTVVCLVYAGFVHKEKVDNYGKQFVVNLLCGLGFVIPLICTFIYLPLAMHQASYSIAWVYKCYGIEEDRTAEMCAFDEGLLHQKYGEWSGTVNACLQVACWVAFSLDLVLASNIPEALFYFLIYSHLRWYV